MKKQRRINIRGFMPYFVAALLISSLLIVVFTAAMAPKTQVQSESIALRNVSSEISANGKVDSQNSADLHFQIGGKLVSLPFKEGDSVTEGETIAALDSYTIQKQLEASLNTYRATRDIFDQTKDNIKNGVLQGQEKSALARPSNQVDLDQWTEANIINDMAKRILDQNQASLDNSVINVQLASYAFQLASIQSPIDGIITHEDVKVPYQNISPATTFSVKDPNTMIFRAQVSDSDIDYVSVGSSAEIHLNGKSSTIQGVVINLNPIKTTDPSGASYYLVDIQSDQLTGVKFDQGGFARIKSNTPNTTYLVPSWTIVNGDQIWVEENNKKVLKTVQTGKTHDSQIEVVGGLSQIDKIIVNPEAILTGKYKIL